MPRSSVFISYAHKDSWEFTNRLAFALSMYMDVFWDKRLPTGNYPLHLWREIEERDFFILVMSSYALREDGYCSKELEHAEAQKPDKIALARVSLDTGNPVESKLTAAYTYGDFTENFDVGFRRLTAMMLGQPLSSWEYLPDQEDKVVLSALQNGQIPALIAKSLAEWVLTERLWLYVEKRIGDIEQKHGLQMLFRGEPRTPFGMLRHCTPLQQQLSGLNHAPGVHFIAAVSNLLGGYVKDAATMSDDSHKKSGEITFNLLLQVRALLVREMTAWESAYSVRSLQDYFLFDAAEKLRELITMHARRSRYLY